MNNFEKFIKVSSFVQEINLEFKTNYGTEDFSFYFYSLIKILKPKCILELGTGYGCTTYMAALACESNQYGKVVTVDDGCMSPNINLFDFLYKKTKEFQLENYIDFRKDTVNLVNLYQLSDLDEIDLIFNDINSSPEAFYGLLAWAMSRVKNNLCLITDKGNNWITSTVIKNTVNNLNNGKVPSILKTINQCNVDFLKIVSEYEFSYEIINKKEIHSQDGFAIFRMSKI